ncbi:MAG: cysteine methyltransferase [Gemmatimonadetes bacterium]|nr:cysteine methyltransferase [Gemmatimonadota bacterium]
MTQRKFDPSSELISSTAILTQYGSVQLNWFEQTLMKVSLGAFEPADRRPALRCCTPPQPRGQCLVAQLLAHFRGEKIDFAPPPSLDRWGTEFQVKVWNAIGKIPYGSCLSYGDLARMIGFSSNNARAVASACSRNPLLILIPCHRVVGSTGFLTGYSAGIAWKQALLELEGVPIQNGRVKIFQKHLD